jgi:hypothetical protein
MRSARDAEKRQAKLDDIDRQVADGSLTVRELTDEEKARFGIGDPDKPYRRFFFPGAKPGSRRGEQLYQELSRAVRKSTGTLPKARRIYRLDCQIEGADVQLTVGEEEPVGKDVVIAIFDLGGEERFAVCTDGTDDDPAFRLDAPDEGVLEFA